LSLQSISLCTKITVLIFFLRVSSRLSTIWTFYLDSGRFTWWFLGAKASLMIFLSVRTTTGLGGSFNLFYGLGAVWVMVIWFLPF
jgi:hypothetical protein